MTKDVEIQWVKRWRIFKGRQTWNSTGGNCHRFCPKVQFLVSGIPARVRERPYEGDLQMCWQHFLGAESEIRRVLSLLWIYHHKSFRRNRQGILFHVPKNVFEIPLTCHTSSRYLAIFLHSSCLGNFPEFPQHFTYSETSFFKR